MASVSCQDNRTACSSTEETVNYTYVVIAAIVGTVIVVANSLVVVAVVRFPILQTVPNMYIVSLACTDILVGLYQYMLMVVYLPNVSDFFYTHRTACVLMYSWAYCTVVCSGFNTCLIACDRYLYMTRPLHYQRLVTERRVKVAIAFAWLAAILYGTSLLYVNTFRKTSGCNMVDVVPVAYRSYSTTSIFLICCTITGAIYISIARLTLRHIKRIAETNRVLSTIAPTSTNADLSSDNPTTRSFQLLPAPKPVHELKTGTLKALRMFVVAFGIMVLCWAPYFLLDIISLFYDVNHTLYFCALFLGFLNSGMNVLVYPAFNPRFRTVLKHLATCSHFKNPARVTPFDSTS